MIKSITVTNYRNESLKIVLTEAEPDSGLLLTNITGLGPVKAQINETDIVTEDGGVFNSARLGSRNIVIYLTFQWGVDEESNFRSIEDVRQLTYKYFPSKKPLTLLVETDNLNAEIEGYVETNEPDIFSSEESTQISILCPYPYFHSTIDHHTVFYSIEPLFEFPFENNGIMKDSYFLVGARTHNVLGPLLNKLGGSNGEIIGGVKYRTDRLIEMGSYVYEQYKSIFYSGEDEVGIVITMHAMGEVKFPTIYNIDTREKMAINTDKIKSLTGHGFIQGDDIIISTVTGKLSAKLLRAGIYTNIMNCLDKNADWFKISKGDNIFAYRAEDGIDNLMLSIENKVLYGGI